MERPARAIKCVRTVQYTHSAPGSKLLDPDVPPSGRPRWHCHRDIREGKQVCFVYAPGHEPTDRCSSAGPIGRSSKHFDMQVPGEKKKNAVGRRHRRDNTSSSRRNGSRRSPGSDETATGVLRMTAFRKACMKHSTHRPWLRPTAP